MQRSIGARGQGKTALAKMLSHDHLAMLAQTRDEPRAQSAVRGQQFIGIYLPTRLEWVGGLKNKIWLNEREREELFQWRLNIASCIAFIPTASSCISTYIDGKAKQAQAERELASLLSKDWVIDPSQTFEDLLQLRRHLEDADYFKQIQILRKRAAGALRGGELPVGLAFEMELFAPLRQGIRRLSRLLAINPACSWLVCLDEAEFLEMMDHRVINSHMRAYPDNLFIKLTTMPYCHYTLATNIGAALVPGQDFAYLNMDSDRVLTARDSGDPDTIGTRFGRTLFRKFIGASDPQILMSGDRDPPSAKEVLGESEILDPRPEDWAAESENMRLLERYASPDTIARARKLVGTSRFRPAIARKINGALLLRRQVDELRGNKALRAYSGARMAIRCADDNPRRMIGIFNALIMRQSGEQSWLMAKGRRAPWISPEDQTRAMRTWSATTLNQYRSFPEVGPELHSFINMLGNYMHADLHDGPLTTDQVTSVAITDSISKEDWALVCVAVGQGLLYPNVGQGNPDEMPWREGTFRLAYALAPHFFLLPRRGKAARLTSIQQFHAMSTKERQTLLESQIAQSSLFDEGNER